MAASLSDWVIISVARYFSVAVSGLPVSWCQRSSAARIVTFTTLAEWNRAFSLSAHATSRVRSNTVSA